MTVELLLQQAHAAQAAGRDAESLELLQRAASQGPRNPEAWFHLGNALAVRGEHAKAIAAFERALEFAPSHPDLLVNLGITCGNAGDATKAEDCYRRALLRQPAHAGALGNLAHSLFQREEFAAALDAYDRLIAAMPQAGAEVWNNRGICHLRLGDRAAAERSFRRALSLQPDLAEINANLGFLLYDARRYEDAGISLRKAHELDPHRALVAAQALDVDLQFADWRDFERKRDEILAAVAAFDREPRQSVPPYLLLAICDEPKLQLTAAKRWAWPERKSASASGARRERRSGNGALRIGLVSSAFHEHPVPRLLVELLERLDRERFEVHAYALGRGEPDALRARIERAVVALTELGHLPATAMAERIRADRIDILFDVTGHTGQARPDLFALRPAQIQVSYLGYAGTLGATYYDFVITDPVTTPPSAQGDFVERFCCVGKCYLPSDTQRTVAPPPDRADYGLGEDAFVFASQAAPYKLLPSLFDVWMRLLRSLPDAMLWLRPVDPAAQRNLRAEADRRGVEPRRLAFAPKEPLARYLARYALANLYLDTYPFGSHTTVNDALWMGLPVLTIAGHSMAARTSATQIRAAELPELVAASLDEYEAMAISLARDRARLAALTMRLRKGVRASALFDMARYTKGFEAAVERMWNEG
ncbi:MAG TPA: tetratricopeptide repeat protein [Casimicrobiaceae bacterium]|nr:tetratricopeptide repeat protein [Casimicrobiaceae bacterium]